MKLNIGLNKYELLTDTTENITKIVGINDEFTAAGCSDEFSKQIYVSKDIPKQGVMEVAMHEIFHAMLFETGDHELGCDERFVDAMSRQILHFINNNNIEKIRTFLGGN